MKNAMQTLNQWMILAVAALAISLSADALAVKPEPNNTSDCKNDSTYAEISKAELQKAVADNTATIVDVNSAESYKEHKIGNAISFKATKNFQKALPTDKNAMIVAYCGGPACTAWKKAAMEACKLGYTNVHHYKGGISEWVKN